MRIRVVAACTALSFASLAAQAETEPVRACMESFAAQEFPNHRVSFQAASDRSVTTPLIASTGTQTVVLTATDKSGRILGTATCMVKNTGTEAGSVTIGQIETN